MMLITNDVTVEQMKSIFCEEFPMPDLENKLFLAKRTIIDNGDITAIGLLKLTSEGILIANPSMPRVTRARAVMALVESMKHDAKKFGLDDCHVFVRKSNVQHFLEHAGFRHSVGGKPMIMQF